MFLNNVEKKILNKYIDTYINKLKIDRRTAEGMVKANIIKAKETAIREGVYNLPPDYWKEIFKMEKDNIDNDFTRYYKRAREDGVNDTDIIAWWETYPVERYLEVKTQELIVVDRLTSELVADIEEIDDEELENQLDEIARENYPIYGNILEKSDTGIDADRDLPRELIFRVNVLLSRPGAQKLRKEAQKFSSFNAFIRYLAKEDRLV